MQTEWRNPLGAKGIQVGLQAPLPALVKLVKNKPHALGMRVEGQLPTAHRVACVRDLPSCALQHIELTKASVGALMSTTVGKRHVASSVITRRTCNARKGG